jgi:hypothetical protein
MKSSEEIDLEVAKNFNEGIENHLGIWQEIAAQNGPWIHLNAGQSLDVLATTIINKVLPKKRFPKPEYEHIQKH